MSKKSPLFPSVGKLVPNRSFPVFRCLEGLIFNSFLLLAFFAALAQPALAASKKEVPTNTPKVRPVFEHDGKFGFCLTEQKYDDGRSLTLAMSPSERINLGLTIPKAGFTEGRHYDLNVSLDQVKTNVEKPYGRTVRAVAIDPTALLLQMGKNPSFETALANAQNLSVEAGGKKIVFSLSGLKNAVDALKDCNRANKGKVDEAAAKASKAMPETLRALLLEAGFKDIFPVSMDNIPEAERPADIMWQNGPLLGGVRERLAPKDKSLTELIGLYIQGLKNKCAGTFSVEVGREEKVGNLKLQPAEVQCQMKDSKTGQDKSIVASLLFYLTTANNFTVFTHETPAANKADARTARDALRKVIVQLAKDTNKKP